MNDADLAQQLNTPWTEIFEKELQSSDIEVVRGCLSTSLDIIEQQDRSIGRLKAAFCASIFAIIGLGGHIGGILQRGGDKPAEETGNVAQENSQTLSNPITDEEKLKGTIEYYIEQRKKEGVDGPGYVDPVEEQIRKLRNQK